jgi:triacylglycerol lipase
MSRSRRPAILGLMAISMALTATVIAVPAAAASAAPDPIVLVHGYRGDPSTWADMKAFLESKGRVVVAIDLPGEDNVVNAKAIASLVKARHWSSVDLVGQSMGGLSARYFIKKLRGTAVVDSYVSLGTPQYGLWSACVLPSWYGGQMCPTSSFLSTLNSGDDTPGNGAWTTIYSVDDEYVPNSSSRLDGGACFSQVSGPTHNSMDNDPGVMADVLVAVDGGCPGTFVS